LKKRILFISFLIVVTICFWVWNSSNKNYINYQPKTKLVFQQLPDTVQKLYVYFETAHDTVRHCFGCHDDTIICLDKNIKKVFHTRKPSWWYHESTDGYFLTFDDQTFFLPAGNFPGENTPYILYQKQLYFLACVNLISVSDVQNANYGKYDLSGILNSAAN
jgi:hypothetical protein